MKTSFKLGNENRFWIQVNHTFIQQNLCKDKNNIDKNM